MVFELSNLPTVRLTPGQELQIAKPATDLYVGQILKTVVVKALSDNQVLININGQNINAKTSHHFMPGELLNVKVLSTQKETVLQVQPELAAPNVLQKALLQALPRQAPATDLLALLSFLQQKSNLPPVLKQQINHMINQFVPLKAMPQHISQAVQHSGVFLESALANWRRDKPSSALFRDFKGQCLKLLHLLDPHQKRGLPPLPVHNKNTLPLPGSTPQPFHHASPLPLDLDMEGLLSQLFKHVSHVLARITAHQVNNLSQTDQQNFQIMLDLPIKTPQGLEVIPLLIKKQKAQPLHATQWSVVFALSLEHLGDLQATVTLTQQQLDIRLNTEQKATFDLLKQQEHEIKDLLGQLGLTLRNWTIQDGLDSNHIDASSLHLLDIRI